MQFTIRKYTIRLTRRGTILFSALAIIVVGTLGYTLFQRLSPKDGLKELQSPLCGGAVSRTTVQKTLKDTESVKVSTNEASPGPDFSALCVVTTHEGTSLAARAKVQDTAISRWRPVVTGEAEAEEAGRGITLSAGEAAISYDRRADLYVKCDPPRHGHRAPYGAYALTVMAHVQGDARVDGDPLRQRVAQLALQMARYAQKAAGCREHSPLPAPSDQPVG